MSTDPNNPYNIDHEKERRNIRLFVILIAIGFVAAAVLIGLGFLLDALLHREPVEPPPVSAAESQTAGVAFPYSRGPGRGPSTWANT